MKGFLICVLICLICVYCKSSERPTILEVLRLRDFSKYESLKSTYVPILFFFDKIDTIIFSNYVDQVLKVITDGCVSKISLNDFRKSHTNKNNMINMQNSEFLRETLLIHRFKKIVNDVDPHSLNHDINLLFLNENDTTVLKREDADSSFIHVLQGEVDVKIFVPNDSITFDPSVCEITGDNISRYDAWKNTYVESIKMCIKKNEFLRVPQHWWYTLSSKDTETILGVYKTDTIFTYLQKIVITSGKIINDNISLKDNNYLKL